MLETLTSLHFLLQVNAVNCNTSWKVTLFMKFSDYREDVLKGVSCVVCCVCAGLCSNVFRAEQSVVDVSSVEPDVVACVRETWCGCFMPSRKSF